MIHTTLTPGIKANDDGTFTIDCVRVLLGKRMHLYSKGYITEEDAKQAMHRLIAEKSLGRKQNELPLSHFLKEFEAHRLLHVRKSTLFYGKSITNTLLSPYFDEPLNSVFFPANVRSIYETILQKPYSPEWKNRCIGLLKLMLEDAFSWRYIDASIYQDSKAILESVPENIGAKKRRPIWTKSEKERFLSGIDSPTDHLLFDLLLCLGARIGEFAGLTWDCVDFKKGQIEIKQQLIYEQKGTWVLSPILKTRESYRFCKLPRRLLIQLKEAKDSSISPFLFPSPLDARCPLSKTSIRRKLDHYIKISGVRRITPHCFRHDLATRLLRVCKDFQEVKAAARFLGHSATMMIDTYGHSDEEATLKVLRRLEKDY